MRLKSKTLLITGIGGFIGLRAAELALARGLRVRGIEIDPGRAAQTERRLKGVRVFAGDLADPAVLRRALQGVDLVLHTAAIVAEDGSLEDFRRVNVQATRRLAEAAAAAKARIFLHLSSVMVYGFVYPDGVAEDGPLRGEGNPYCITKIESEATLFELHRPGIFDVIVIRPGDVYGPGSGPWVVRPLELMRRRMFALVDGGRGVINHVYVDNLIDAILLAAERVKNARGLAFNLTDGRATTWREYFTRLAEIGGVPRPFAVPGGLMKAAVRVLNFFRRRFGLPLEVQPAGVDFVRRPYAVSIERAREILGYRPAVDLDEGLRRTAEWLRSERR